MSRYDEDADSGDISLSLSKSSPQLSSILNGTAGPSRYRDAPTSPTPNRLVLGKTLWPRPGPSPTVTDADEVDDDTTPTHSLFRSDERRASAAGLMGASSSGSATANGADSPLAGPTSSASTTDSPTRFTRRTSSSGTITTVSRSRSMNVRLPSIDLSAGGGSGSGSGSGRSREAGARTPSMRVGWSRRPGEARPPPLVPEQVLSKMGRWVKEIVVCNFDLERGPVVERRVMGRRWGPGEKENVAFSSFPDTSLFAEGDITFSFKIRHLPPDDLNTPEPLSPMPGRTLSSEQIDPLQRRQSGLMPGSVNGHGPKHPASMDKEEKAEEYRKWDERGREWLYGFVWFEQRRDGGIARGYMQKSLVILTHLPFPALFASVLDRLAPVFFEHGYSALEAACHAIASWPYPVSNALLELPLLSEVITVKLPDTYETPQVALPPPRTNIPRPILASLPPSTPLRTFATILPSLWSLWECLILAEPVLVIAPDPKTCSEIVWWLRDLLRPIPPAGDFRPYLHIHDHDFSLLVNSNKPQPGVVVGVTNPFFRNAASHWPNVISIPSPRPRRIVNGHKPEQPEGFISRRQRSVQKDRPLLKRLETLVADGQLDDTAGNDALRTHFQQLTEKMLVPLNRYFQTLVPPPSPNPSPDSGAAPPIKPFSLPAFLTHLRTRGPNPLAFKNRGLTMKARVEGDFYTSFCMAPTFAGWLASRVESLGLAVAAQTGNALAVPGAGQGAGTARGGVGVEVGLGISELSLLDTRGPGAGGAGGAGESSPTMQWSSESEARGSSDADGSSVGHGYGYGSGRGQGLGGDEPVRRR